MAKRHLPIISTLLNYYKVYEPYVGKRIYILLALAVVAAQLEGFGLAFFLPLMSADTMSADQGGLAGLLAKFYGFFGFELSHMTSAIFIVIIFTFKGIVKYVEGHYNAHLTTRVVYSGMRKDLIARFFGMSYLYYTAQNTGTLTNVITHEVDRSIKSFRFFSLTMVQIATILSLLVYSFLINWQITGLALMYGLLILYLFKPLSARSKKFSIRYSREHGVFHALLIQAFQAFKYLRSTRSLGKFTTKTSGNIDDLSSYTFEIHKAGATIKAIAEPLVIYFIVLLIGIYVGVLGHPIGEITVNILLLFRLMMNVMGFQTTWQQFSGLLGGVDSVNRTIAAVAREPEVHGDQQIDQLKQGIRLDNVCFSYDDKEVLSDISLFIPKNRTIALVGESGSGKSTIIDLLTGVLRPTKGAIDVDGIDSSTIDYNSFREKIGYVAQENVVFDDSVANNISLWSCAEESAECRRRVEEAAQQAFADEYIRALDDAYDTPIGDRGVKLSGGQRQRLTIARELFRHPELLLLDEATSALDTESEKKIQKSIDDLKGKTTVVIIAHRLSTIRNSDYIYVLDRGRIAEHGTFQELVNANDSKFRKMVELQNIA